MKKKILLSVFLTTLIFIVSKPVIAGGCSYMKNPITGKYTCLDTCTSGTQCNSSCTACVTTTKQSEVNKVVSNCPADSAHACIWGCNSGGCSGGTRKTAYRSGGCDSQDDNICYSWVTSCQFDSSCPGGSSGTTTTTSTSTSTTTTSTTTTTTNTTNTALGTRLASSEGSEDLCQSLTATKTALGSGESLTLTATSKNNADVKTFTFLFFNQATGKPIKFSDGEYKKTQTLDVYKSSLTTGDIAFSEFTKPDLNWSYYANWPKNIVVEAYLTKPDGKTSKFNAACQIGFTVNSFDPTPTPNPNCKCASNVCDTSCFSDYYSDVTYTKPQKCGVITSIYQSTPTSDQQNKWCTIYKRVQGDSDGDGKVTMLDYFYFTSVKLAGAKIPAAVNIDFNGDGNVGSDDRAIIVKSLKSQ